MNGCGPESIAGYPNLSEKIKPVGILNPKLYDFYALALVGSERGNFENYLDTIYGIGMGKALISDENKNLDEDLREFYSDKNPNLNDTVLWNYLEDDSSNSGLFSSIEARDCARNYCIHLIRMAYATALNSPKKTTLNKSKIINYVFKNINNELNARLNRCLFNIKDDDEYEKVSSNFKDSSKEGEDPWYTFEGKHEEDVREFFDKYGNSTDVEFANLANTVTLYLSGLSDEEYSDPIANRFIDSLFNSNEVSRINFAMEHSDEEYSDNNDNGDSTEEEGEKDEFDYDRFITNAGQHLGDMKSFTEHIPDDLKEVFSSIPIVTNFDVDGNPVYDINNPLGVISYMDSNSAWVFMLSQLNYTSPQTMVESMINKADSIPGFGGFKDWIQGLVVNHPEYIYKMYNVFGNTIFNRIESQVNIDGSTIYNTNMSADTEKYLTFEYLNTARSTTMNANTAFDDRTIEAIKNILDYKQLEDITNEPLDTIEDKALQEEQFDLRQSKDYLIKYLTDVIGEYFITIDSTTIRSFINNYGDKNIKNNARLLLEIAEYLKEGAKNTYNNYEKNLKKFGEIKANNEKSKKAGVVLTTLPNPYDVFKEDILDSNINKAVALAAKYFKDFTFVKTELNSRNVYNNLSSDVLHNNMLSNLKMTLSNDEVLKKFGEYKLKDVQYNFSNILLEQRDESGNIIHLGLFTKDANGIVKQTPYAQQLLQESLYNGATNTALNKAATYQDMTHPDFVASSFINFFSEQDIPEAISSIIGKRTDINIGTYFTRIPSDAPKIFCFSAPRYSAKNLYISSNQASITSKVNAIMRRLYIKPRFPNLKEKITYNTINVRTFIANALNPGKDITSPIYEYFEEKGKAYIRLKVQEGNNFIFARFTGEAIKDENGDIVGLHNSSFAGIESTGEAGGTEFMRNSIEEYIKDSTDGFNESEKIINDSHPLFQMLKNIFIQELTDAARAVDVIFNHDSNGKIFEGNYEGYSTKYENYTNPLYNRYHYNGKLIKDGKLTGKVFHSNRFTLFVNGKSVNYGERLMNGGLFNILYGGDNTGSLLSFTGTGNNVKVVLSDEQESAIDAMLDEYIKALLNDTKTRLSEYKNIIDSKYQTDEAYLEYAINTQVMLTNYDDILEGNTKFYKNNQDILKRAKEHQGSGTPFGNTDYLNNFVYDDRIYDDANNHLGRLNIRIPGLDHRIEGKPCFKAITVYNTQRTSEDAESLFYTISNNFKDQGYSDVEADEMAMTLVYGPENKNGERTTGFQNTKINDAQSYITLEEWIRRIYNRGDYAKYKNLIDKLINPNSKFTDEELTEFVQVQKNFYYDQYYDEHTGVIAPRQIKNAEFVLVPQFIKGTELEKVYDMMVRQHVDQLNTIETSKAANHKILTLWDNDRKLVDLEKFEKDIPGAIEYYNYNYLYVQQKTPQHMEAENKAGLQIMKKLIDNIPQYVYKNGKRSEHPLWRVKQRFISAYCSNIKESYEDLMNELGIAVSPIDGTLDMTNINYDILDEKLKVEAMRKGLDDNIMDFITRDETGVPLMPSFMGVLSNKFQNIFQSLFNNSVTRQKLPGFHASQVTSLGLEQNIPYHDGPLRYHPDGKPYIEVLIPKPQSLKDIPDEEIFKKGEDGLNMLERAEVDKFIGYRIPTEGKQSVAVMKIVGFLDYKQGSTIVVPDDWVSQTGSDFDIDSVYGVTYNMWVTKDKKGNYKIHKNEFDNSEEIGAIRRRYAFYVYDKLNKEQRKEFDSETNVDENELNINTQDLDSDEIISIKTKEKNKLVAQKSFAVAERFSKELKLLSFEDFKNIHPSAQNTREQRNAEILDCMIEIMSHPSVDPEVFHRSHFEDLTESKERIMSEVELDRRSNRSPYNALDQAELQADVMGGAKLKAISVTYDNLCSVCNNAQGKITDEIWIKYPQKDYNINKLKERFGEDNVRKEDDGSVSVRHNMVGWSNDNLNIDDQIITVYSSETTAHAVDAVKEGAIPNVNTRSFGIYKLFLNLGSNFDAAISFMMQPAVTRIANAYDVNESIYTDEHDYNPIDTSIKLLADELGLEKAKYKTIEEVINYVNENYKDEIKAKWGVEAFSVDTLLTFSIEDQIGRIKNGSVVTRTNIHNNFYSGEITANDPAIFVFGSNEIGVNGNPSKGTGGAALSALQQGRVKQGEIMTNRFSDNGRSYGLVTVHAPKQPLSNNEVVNKERIAQNISLLYTTARNNPDKQFKIAYTNTGDKSLNGLTGREMANLFILAAGNEGIPSNISFSEEWKNAGYFSKIDDAKQLIYDLGVMLQYKYLNDIAETHNNYARVVNPDKFGADKDLFNVRKKVSDIRTIIRNSDRGKIYVNGDDILEALYPKISTTDKEYYKNQYNNSVYPQLDYFLRYSTIASNLVNRRFLETEDEDFVKCINGLEGWLKIGSKMSNDLYNDFQKYVLSYVYNHFCNFITRGYDVESKEYSDEINRIFGYGKKPDVPFITNSPTSPSNTEIAEFNKLSPAQKVFWIKEHFNPEGAPLFHNLNVNLYNAWEYSRKGISKQSITYKDNAQNINAVYQQFMFAFANSNPLIRSAAEDIIRYAIVVEGFNMRKNGVSRIIKNKALIDAMLLDKDNNDTHTEGTSIVDDARDGFNTIISYPSEDAFWQERYYNFIRSHSDYKGVATSKNKKIDGKEVIDGGYFGVMSFNLDDNKDIEKLLAIGVIKENKDGGYDTVRIINIIKDTGSQLYRVKKKDGKIFMYSVNKLEENEDKKQSSIKDNHNSVRPDFYEYVIECLLTKPITKELSEELRKKYEEARIVSDIISISDSTEDFDINNPPYGYELGFKQVIKSIEDADIDSSTGEMVPIFIRSIALDGKPEDKLRKDGFIVNTSIQTVNVNNQTKYIKITKYNKEIIKKLIENNDPKYQQQLKDLLSSYKQNPNDTRSIYRIEEFKGEESYDSGVTSLASIAYDDLQRRVRVNQDMTAKDILSELERKDIISADILKMEGKEQTVLEYHLNYLRESKRNMEYKISHYVQDENVPDLWHSIDSEYVIQKVASDDKFANKFLSDIMAPRTYAKYIKELLDINIAGEDRKMQETLNSLIKIVNEIVNNQKCKTAFDRYTTDVLAKESTNPLYNSIDPSIIVDVLDMRDQFEQLSWFESWISDVQETNIPIVQMVLKKFHRNVRAANMLAEDKANDFIKEMARLREEARKAGMSFDYSHFITPDGKFITEYNDKYEKDYNELVLNLRAQEPNTKEYYVALNKLKHWKYENTHQQLKDEYYRRELDLEDNMLYNHTDVFVKYMNYRNKMYNILQKAGIERLTPDLQREYNFYKDCIHWLQSEYSDPDSDPKSDEEIADAKALADYINGMKKLNHDYKSREEVLTFQDNLNTYLNYILRVEKRDENGIPTVDADILMEDEKYREAINWIRNNTIWVPSEEIQDDLERAYEVLNKSFKADDSLPYLLRKVHPDARDEDRIVDGRVFTEEEIATLKKETEIKYGYRDGEPMSDKALIKNDTRPVKSFVRGFYENMKVPGMTNLQYKEIVEKINNILRPYYNKRLKRVELHNMTAEELNKLGKLYEKLSPLHSKDANPDDRKRVNEWIKKNVHFNIDEKAFKMAESEAKYHAATSDEFKNQKERDAWLTAWYNANTILEDGDTEPKINHYIYGFIEPKANVYDLYYDERKTEALSIIYQNTKRVTTKYYHMMWNQKQIEGQDAFEKWYNDNHVYNPTTHEFEPLKIWTRSAFNDESEAIAKDYGMYMPSYSQTIVQPREGMENKDYIPNLGIGRNYKASEKYNNRVSYNSYEKEAMNYIKDILNGMATFDSAKRFFEKGYLPNMAKTENKDAKWIAKEVGKTVGLSFGSKQDNGWKYQVGYDTDTDPLMPMVKKFDKPTQSIPARLEGESLKDYEERIKPIKEANEKIEKENKELRERIISQDWEEVIRKFIIKGSDFNARQENKHLLYYGLEAIKSQKVYQYSKKTGKIVKNKNRNTYIQSDNEQAVYLMENTIRRLLFDQWKEPSGNATKIANNLQGLVSAKFMMMNITGGIANVTLGLNQIAMEAFAKEYFGVSNWNRAATIYSSNSYKFIADMFTDKPSSMIGAIIKKMNIVEFDRITELAAGNDTEEMLNKAREFAYSPQSMGEHFMQNTAMLAMMDSHRVYTENGKIKIGNIHTYLLKSEEQALLNVISSDEDMIKEYQEFRHKVFTDKDVEKDYALFKEFLTTSFLRRQSEEVQRNYIKERDKLINEKTKEFNEYNKLIDNFDFVDGELTFKNELKDISKEDAYKLLADFKGKVISVNKKIHGVYDKYGAARMEQKWFGGIIMQYHKHIWPGIMKRYRRKGYWNEERQTIEKGNFWSLVDFLAIPFRDAKAHEFTDADGNAIPSESITYLESIQNVLKHVVTFATHIKLNWQLLPESERANIQRMLGDLCGVLGAFMLSLATRILADDDDKEKLLYNVLIYEADRLMSESSIWSIGLPSEAKKLWSSPVAAEASISDVLNASQVLVGALFNEDYDMEYQSGLYAGENKAWVLLRRQILIYRSYMMLSRMKKNNSYYKLDENMLSIIPVQKIADTIKH